MHARCMGTAVNGMCKEQLQMARDFRDLWYYLDAYYMVMCHLEQ